MMDDKLINETERVIREHHSDIIIGLFEQRARQNLQWGGEKHDDQHTAMDWTAFLDKQLDKLRRCDSEGEAFQKLIEIAALAVSGAEALQRRHAASCPVCQLEQLISHNIKAQVATGAETEGLLGVLLQAIRNRYGIPSTEG